MERSRALMRREGSLAAEPELELELEPYSGGWSVGSLLCVCVSGGPVCVHRVGGDGDGDGECGQPELAGWVMNLLLRHSLKHNYTHQSQEGPTRPLTLS